MQVIVKKCKTVHPCTWLTRHYRPVDRWIEDVDNKVSHWRRTNFPIRSTLHWMAYQKGGIKLKFSFINSAPSFIERCQTSFLFLYLFVKLSFLTQLCISTNNNPLGKVNTCELLYFYLFFAFEYLAVISMIINSFVCSTLNTGVIILNKNSEKWTFWAVWCF